MGNGYYLITMVGMCAYKIIIIYNNNINVLFNNMHLHYASIFVYNNIQFNFKFD